MALSENPNLALIPSGYKSGKIYSVLPTSGVGDFDFSRSGTATRINSQGLIETVASGVSRLNYPMIDGVVKGCPSHLLENSATNLITYSEAFDNSYWSYYSGVQLSSTTTITPSGSTNAVRIKNVGGANNDLRSVVPITIGLTYTNSVYIRRVSGVGNIKLKDVNNGGVDINGLTSEWQKFSSTVLSNSTNGRFYLEVSTLNDEIEVWGAQLEQGSYPTSYIPTNGSATTRSAETANNSGDASTFNDSEGVLMAEISALDDDLTNRRITISDNTTNNRIVLGFADTSNTILALVGSNGTQFISTISISDTKLNNKFALKYKQNDFALWVNGIEIATGTSGNTPLNLNNLKIQGSTGFSNFYGNTKQIQYYDSALTDSELETLTSWVSFSDMAEGQLYTIE